MMKKVKSAASDRTSPKEDQKVDGQNDGQQMFVDQLEEEIKEPSLDRVQDTDSFFDSESDKDPHDQLLPDISAL